MANIEKSGNEIASDQQTGAPSGTAAAQVVAQPIAAPAKGHSAVRIILIVVAVLVVLGVVAAGAVGYVAWRVSKAVHVGPNGAEISLQTPEGKITANSSDSFTPAELGTDLYPGAISVRGGMKMDMPTGSMVTAIYATADSSDKVAAFYKEKIGSAATFVQSSDKTVITLGQDKPESLVVTITANSSQDSGKTRIVILHSKKGKAS